MKTLIKVVLVAALFCGAAFADDGDLGNGGLWAGTPVSTTQSAEGDGDLGNGGKTCPQGQTCIASQPNDSFSFLAFVRNLIAGV